MQADPLAERANQMLSFAARDVSNPAYGEQSKQKRGEGPRREKRKSSARWIDAAGCGHSNPDISQHLALEPTPVRDGFEPGESFTFGFALQLDGGGLKPLNLFPARSAGAKMEPDFP